MEKYILRWSYWLGVVCFLIAVVWRVVIVSVGHTLELRGITYMSAYKSGLMLVLIALATTGYLWSKAQKL